MRGRDYTARDAARLSTVFSRAVFRALGSEGAASMPPQVAGLRELGHGDPGLSLAGAFDLALEVTARKYRNEYYYKNTLITRIVFGRHSPRTAAPLLEVRAGGSIADVVVYNGTSTAYEIKTDYDDYSRLRAQLADYSRCFERAYLVVSPARISAALATAPKHVGVISVTSRGSLSENRPATPDLARMSHAALSGILHRGEILRVLRRTHDYEIDVPPAELWQRTRDLFATLPIDVAHAEVVVELRNRGRRAAAMAEAVPASLRAMAYDVPLSAAGAARITHRLAQPAADLVV